MRIEPLPYANTRDLALALRLSFSQRTRIVGQLMRRILCVGLCAVLGISSIGSAQPHTRTLRIEGELYERQKTLKELLRISALTPVATLNKLPRCNESVKPTETERERHLLDQLGYCVEHILILGNEVTLKLGRRTVIRKVYIQGNWPLFEEDIYRRLRLRPGQRLPFDKKSTDIALEREGERLKRYLARQGYPKGRVLFKLSKRDKHGRVNLYCRLIKGKSYKVGNIEILPMDESIDPKTFKPAIDKKKIDAIFSGKILLYRRNFSTERFKENVQSLIKRYHRAGYAGVRVKGSYTINPKKDASQAVEITLRIQERKKLNIRYEGNNNLSEDELNKVLTLFSAGAYDDYELGQSARAISRLYQRNGYLRATVGYRRIKGPAQSKKSDSIVFRISEGVRFRVKEVLIRGNKIVKTETIRDVIKTVPFPFLGWIGLGSGGYLTKLQIDQDKERILSLYHSLGFPEAKVRANFAPIKDIIGKAGALAAAIGSQKADTNHLYLRFDIEEGPQIKVSSIRLWNTKALKAKKLLKQLQLRVGRPYTEEALTTDKARIIQIYAEKGYPYATVRLGLPHAQIKNDFEIINEKDQTVDINLTIDEGKRVHFGPIFVRGNFHTQNAVIINSLTFKSGDRFNIRAIENSERKLRNLDIFKSVRIQFLDLPAKPDLVSALIIVDERYDDYGGIGLGVGASTDNSIFGTVSYTWKNVFGLGFGGEVKGEFGPEIQSGNLTLSYPQIFGSEYRGEIRFFVRNEVTERLGDIFTYGASLTLSRQLLLNLKGVLRYGISQIETREPLHRPSGPVNEDRTRPVTSRTGALTTALIFDKRDNPISPSKGFYLQGHLRWASEYLGGTADFIALRLYGSAYIPLPWNMLLAVGSRYDHGFPLRGAVLLPKTERFYAGGDTTIRGFEEDRAFAERIESTLSPLAGASYIRLVPQGGNIRLLTNIELQFPIWKESPLGTPLYGALFLDNGMVTNSFEYFEWSDFRHGAGLALRISTYVGFASLEYAWPLDPKVGDIPPLEFSSEFPFISGGRFHFNFGFIF